MNDKTIDTNCNSKLFEDLKKNITLKGTPIVKIRDLSDSNTSKASNNEFIFPMLPEKISVQTSASFQSYTIMGLGEVKFPFGENCAVFSWSGTLPGELRKYDPYVTAWKDPREIQSLWSDYRAKKKKLSLEISNTPILHEVFLDSYSVDYSGAYGDYSYQISFVQAKQLKIYTESESNGVNAGGAPSSKRSTPETPKTYTIKSGDTLWGIAQKYLGDGSKYKSIHDINQPPLAKDPDKIYPGQVIKLPQ